MIQKPPKKHTDQTPLFTSGGMILVWLDVKRFFGVTPPKTNMEPENEPLEEEIPMKNHHL